MFHLAECTSLLDLARIRGALTPFPNIRYINIYVSVIRLFIYISVISAESPPSKLIINACILRFGS